MGSSISFLIAVLYHSELIWCALKIERDMLTGDCESCPMEPENKAQLHKHLPLHVRNCGDIVEVRRIFEVAVVEAPKDGVSE